MAYNRNLYTSADSALDSAIIYDQGRQKMQSEINEGVIDGDIVVGLADNLASSTNQYSTGEFRRRTTGGNASLSDGDGHLVLIRGSYVHTGYTAPSVETEVVNAARDEGEEEISVSIDQDTFLSEMSSENGTFEFLYTTTWNYLPSSYGVIVIGAPKSGDSITVTYQKEIRGTIVQSTPETFVSTRWNLYDHTAGCAKLVYYSSEYGFGIDGTYTSLAFSETEDGERESVTVTNGRFTIPSDGYLWVTGGNNTDTAIWMTWSDWTEGYVGAFETYSETSIDLSELMETYFPYGLLQVGNVRDEIDLSLGRVTNNVGRIAYSASNLETVQAYGTEYEYDENYIYYGLTEPIITSISIDNSYHACDHGIEYFIGTTLPIYAQLLYGVNLKNRLERDVVLKSGDTMSGNLNIGNGSPGIILKTTAMDATASSYASTSNSYGFRLRDKNDKNVAIITDRYLSNGSTGLWLSGWKTVNGTTFNNILGIYVDKDGNKVVDLYPAPWRTALNVVDKSGDTMTGDLILQDAPCIVKDTSITSGTAPSSNFYGKAFYLNDSQRFNIGTWQLMSLTNGREGFQLAAAKKTTSGNKYNYVRLLVDATGNPIVDLSGPAAWRAALGLGSPTVVNTQASIINPGNGITIVGCKYVQWGNIGQLYLRWKSSSAVTVEADGNATNVVVGVLVSGKRPAVPSVGVSMGDSAGPAFHYIADDGSISLCACGGTGASRTIAAGREFYCMSTFILP